MIRLIAILIISALCFQELCAKEKKHLWIDTPIYDGGFYGGFKWLFLQPIVSDSDLQYGTALTLTGPPLNLDETQNLTAHTIQIEPDFTSAYRLDLGYAFPCTNYSLDLSYFYFRATDSDSTTSQVRNAQTYQFLQNFLGGGYVSSSANDRQKIDQVDLSIGGHFIVSSCLNVRPYCGLGFAYIQRDFNVEFSDFSIPPDVNPIPATLTASLQSQYWGLGPTLGSHFSFPIFPCFKFSGHLGLSALVGHISSKIDSNSVRPSFIQSFDSRNSSFQIVPILSGDLGLTYTHLICNDALSIDLTAGYQVDYYFYAVDRVNPANGYVNNPNTTATNTSSNLGLGGPYAQIALTKAFSSCRTKRVVDSFYFDQNPACGFHFSVENGWLKPSPTNKDLTYATLNSPSGSSDQKVVPEHSWSGSYCLGYRFSCNVDLQASYRYFQNEESGSVIAGSTEGISSLNASGPSGVLFSNANSRVNYRLHQFDLSVGKYAQFYNQFDLYGFLGLRYSDLNRTLHNAYLGGVPSALTESKFSVLKSDFKGVGPLLGIRPMYYLCTNFGLTGLLDVALLIGDSKSTLDQINFGTISQQTSNDLSTRHQNIISPVLDTKLGLFWMFKLGKHLEFNLEAGYLFSEYFRAVNLVFPNFLTGLNQNNSNLLLSGPYITLNINW